MPTEDPLRPPLPEWAYPRTSGELITVMAHYHRAEIARMAGWRDRLDRTTNWAITVVAAMLSVALSTPTAHHGVLIFAMVLVLLLLVIETRRYRFFDVYRSRVRLIERNYFAQIFDPAENQRRDWLAVIGADLRKPLFLMSAREAMARRLRRNYCWLFLVLLLAWLLKTTTTTLAANAIDMRFVGSLSEWSGNAALGALNGWIVIALLALLYGGMLALALPRPPHGGESAFGDVHV